MNEQLTITGYADGVTLAEREDGTRTISGTITQFGVEAESHGLIIEAGALEPRTPISRVKLLRDHDHADPVGYALEISDDRLTATFAVPAGANGDRALAEARDKLRDGLSVGFRIAEYTWDDDAVLHVKKAELYEVSLCAIPAFQDAQVTDVAASMAARKENNTMPENTAPATTEAPAEVEASTPLDTLANLSESQRTELIAALSSGPDTHPQAAPVATATPRPVSLKQVIGDVSAAIAAGDSHAVRLALSDVVPADDTGAGLLRDDWRGQLWTADRTDRPIVDALGTPTPLGTGTKVKGWKWETKPDVQDYSGKKTAVPSNKVKTVPAEAAVHRVAGGWDIDRIFLDLGEAGFLEAFWNAAVADYKLDSENYAAAQMVAGATDGGTSATLLAALSDLGATFAGIGAHLDAIFIAPDLFEPYSSLTQAEVPFWLANATGVSLRDQSATVGDLSIRTHPALDPGTVLAFDRRSATYYEKTPPIRVNAVDLPKGGIDLGLFGYDALLVNDARANVTKRVGESDPETGA